MLLVDTNVLVDVLEDDPDWADWSIRQLRHQSQVHDLLINPVIYSELSLTFDSAEALDEAIEAMELRLVDLTRPALFLAGKAFVKYRRRGGRKHNVLADFFIGAQAAVLGCTVLTRDAKRYRSYFPSVPLLVPDLA
jgi:predicted nucleic acid-binding protein